MFYVPWLLRYHNRSHSRNSTVCLHSDRLLVYTRRLLYVGKSKSVLLAGISVPTHKAFAALLLLLLSSYSLGTSYCRSCGESKPLLMACYVISIWRRQSTVRNVSRWDTTKLAWLLKHECMYLRGCIVDIRQLPRYNVAGPLEYARQAFIRVLKPPCANICPILPLVAIIYLGSYLTRKEKL